VNRLRAVLIAAGVAGMGYAALGLLLDPGVRLGGVLLFLVAVLAVHDGVWMPAVLATGALITRFVPGRHRRRVRVALLAAVAVAAVGVPLVLSPGRSADNPSVLPLHYGRNLAIVLALIAVAAVAAAVGSRKKSERRRPGRSGPADG
jgi:hypothetical protein